ncbi:MAG: hypothetical protein ACFE8V_04665 [Promethearchaeota archaeon]
MMMVKKKDSLTNAIIKKNTDSTELNLNQLLSEVKDSRSSPYLLIIQSNTENYVKLTVYPIKHDKIIKLTLKGVNILYRDIEILSKRLQEFNIIHTTGLVSQSKNVIYECYLDLRKIDDVQYYNLEKSLDKIKNVFKDIKIEEISLNKG